MYLKKVTSAKMSGKLKKSSFHLFIQHNLELSDTNTFFIILYFETHLCTWDRFSAKFLSDHETRASKFEASLDLPIDLLSKSFVSIFFFFSVLGGNFKEHVFDES